MGIQSSSLHDMTVAFEHDIGTEIGNASQIQTLSKSLSIIGRFHIVVQGRDPTKIANFLKGTVGFARGRS